MPGKRNMNLKLIATSHGKGVVDGLGGTMKRAVWRHVRSGHAHVSNPEEYAAVVQQRNPKFVSKSSIEDMYTFLDAKWEGVKAVPQAHKMHCVSSSQLMVAETSDATEFEVVSIYKSRTTNENPSSGSDSDSESDSGRSDAEAPQDEAPQVNIKVGQWVIVNMKKSARTPTNLLYQDGRSFAFWGLFRRARSCPSCGGSSYRE